MRRIACAAFLTGVLCAAPAHAETTECTVINSIPMTITQQGVSCLKGNLSTDAVSGNMIEMIVGIQDTQNRAGNFRCHRIPELFAKRAALLRVDCQ